MPSKLIRGVIIAALLVLMLVIGSSYYTVNSEELGVVTRFGRYHSLAEPGLHFRLPLGIDRVQTVAVQRQQKQEFGFRTTRSGDARTEYDSDPHLDEALMVTGDLNAAVVEWSVQYRMDNARDYVFNLRDPEQTLLHASEAVMREVVGDHTVDEVLTVLRQKVASDTEIKLQQLMDNYRMGIHIDRVVLQGVKVPERVFPAFTEVTKAQQEREKLINEARAEYNRFVPRAAGQALQRIQEAEGYALERVNQSQGDALRFSAVLTQYLKAPEVTRKRLYLETMQEVLPKMGRKFVIDDQARSILPLLSLDGAGAQTSPAAPAAAAAAISTKEDQR